MKRMKKKVVAMVTLAMFIMTLLPMAAFADTENKLSIDNTQVTVNEDTEVTVTTDGAKTAPIELWAAKVGDEKTPVKVATFTGSDGSVWGQVDGIVKGSFTDKQTFKVKFSSAGEYKIMAAKVIDMPVGQEDQYAEFVSEDVVTVSGVEVQSVESAGTTVDVDEQNGVITNAVNVKVTPVDGGQLANLKDTAVTIDNAYESAGLKVVDADGKEIDKVDLNNQGEATFYVTYKPVSALSEDEVYNLDLTCNEVTGNAPVTVKANHHDKSTIADSIEALPVEDVVTADGLDKVQFAVRNAAGDLINPNPDEAFENAGGDHDKYVNVISPKSVKDSNFTLKFNPKTELMELKSVATLKPGKYTVEFVLKSNGEKATTTFTVDKFGKLDHVEIVPADKVVGTDVVVNGKATTYEVYKVDEQGISEKVTNYSAAYRVPENEALTVNTNTLGKIKAACASEYVKDVLGSKVTATVAYTENGVTKMASEDFTLVSKTQLLSDYELVADYKDGKVLTNNKIKVNVVNKKDSDKELVIDNLYVKAVDPTNPQAKVVVKVADDKKSFTVYSDKNTSVDLQVVAFANDKVSGKIELSKNFTYTIGAKDIHANTLVALTIGSKDMIVNNEVVALDAAPYVDKNWRTMVPLRAITEAFGVEPEWDNDNRTVTVEKDGVKVVMTIDKKTYTVNGKEKTMDTAPVINNSRTMVPVRFVAEELGFKVAPLYSAADGTTEGVVITK